MVVKLAMASARFQDLEVVKKFGAQKAAVSATTNVAKPLPIGNFLGVVEDEEYELDLSVYFPGRGL